MASVASRYARALVEIVLEKQLDANVVVGQLNALVAAVEESADLRRVWESPAVAPEQKRAILDAMVARIGAERTVRNFIAVLIDHRRIAALALIVRQFQAELDTQLGFAEASITSARQLSDAEKRELELRIEQMTGKKVRATYAADPQLLGGVVVRLDSTIYDGSVRGQLQKMREQLSAS